MKLTATKPPSPLGLFANRPTPRLYDAVSRSIRGAVLPTDITKRVTAHTFRQASATHLIKAGDDIRTMQELLGHSDVRTTTIYTHVLNQGGQDVRSPADFDGLVSE
jgi:site-specific recombinase XerD